MSNITKPDVVWVEGRCYRLDDATKPLATSYQEHDLYENEPSHEYFDEDDNSENCNVEEFGDSRFRTSLHVPKHYLGSIIGKKGAVVSRLKKDTGTDIKTPKFGQSGDVVIQGNDISSVKAARRRINNIVTACRMKQRPTHFIAVPLNSPEIMNKFIDFKESVLKECPPDTGIDETLFISPEKLHLTLAVMCLMDAEEREIATKLLEEARDKIIIPAAAAAGGLRVSLRGAAYMNDDPAAVHVLYARVEPNAALDALASGIVDLFYNAGFIDKERNTGKLHATLMNTRYRAREEAGAGGERRAFDGSAVLVRFADFEFGSAEVPEVRLLQMSSDHTDRDGYRVTAAVACQ